MCRDLSGQLCGCIIGPCIGIHVVLAQPHRLGLETLLGIWWGFGIAVCFIGYSNCSGKINRGYNFVGIVRKYA